MDHRIEISPTIEGAMTKLLAFDAAILEAGKRTFADEAYLPDLFVASVLNRTLQLLHGFVVLIRNRNYLSAAPLFRLQLDNGLRLWAASMVQSFDVFTVEVLGGKRIDKMKSKSGEWLTDRYLVTTLSESLSLPKLVTAYEYSSGFVHLSGQHVLATHQVTEGGKLLGRIVRLDDTLSDEKWLELIEGFSSATGIVLDLVEAWSNQKTEERQSRDKTSPTRP